MCSIERGSIQCTNQNRILHLPNIRFLFPVSFIVEYKVGIAEFYPYVGFRADLLKNVVTRAENCQNRNPHISKIGKLFPVCPTNNMRRKDHICEPHAKFGENR